MRFALVASCVGVLLVSVLAAQDTQDVVKRGNEVFADSCTGYCHAAQGAAGGGAPRLAARGFDEGYINNVVTRGIAGTTMRGFAATLPRADLTAVIAYVATLNGIANPTLAPPALAGFGAPPALERSLPLDVARGRNLFFDATRGFGRCSTCHEVDGQGISVAAPLSKTPEDVRSLRALATPLVSTVTMNGSAMPALVLSKGRNVVFYDLTTPPPVLVTAQPSSVSIAEGSMWRHASVIGAYKDDELESILRFLRETK